MKLREIKALAQVPHFAGEFNPRVKVFKHSADLGVGSSKFSS